MYPSSGRKAESLDAAHFLYNQPFEENMADYTEDQSSIGAWIDDTFPGGVAYAPRKAVRALEEVIELCIAAGASNAEIMTAVRKALGENKEPNLTKVPEEAADVVIVLYGLAHLDSFDLHDHIDTKMKKNRARKWKPNGDGTGYHIKENYNV